MLVFSDDFQKMFNQVHYSDTGTNARTKEEQAYMFFIVFLEECEQSKQMHSCMIMLLYYLLCVHYLC